MRGPPPAAVLAPEHTVCEQECLGEREEHYRDWGVPVLRGVLTLQIQRHPWHDHPPKAEGDVEQRDYRRVMQRLRQDREEREPTAGQYERYQTEEPQQHKDREEQIQQTVECDCVPFSYRGGEELS